MGRGLLMDSRRRKAIERGAEGAPLRAVSEPEGRAPAAPPGRRRSRGPELALLAGAVIVLLAFLYGFNHHRHAALAALLLLCVLAVLALSWRWLAQRRMARILMAGVLLLPAAALLGPILALPSLPQVFAYRVLLGLVVYGAITWLLLSRRTLEFAAADIAVWLALWFGWLIVGLVWAGDKGTGLRYLLVLLTMMLLVAATAAAGTSRRRLQIAGLLFILAFAAIIGITVLEYTVGFRLATSHLNVAFSSQSFAVTSVFHNQNDLATYLAICWPFMLCAYFFTQRIGWLGLATLSLLFSAAAFVRTGSRSSLLAVGIECLVALAMFGGIGGRLATRRGKIVGVVVAVVLVAAGGYLLFNNSQSTLLRQFRLETLLGQAKSNEGSGAIRADLTHRGFDIAGGSYLLGAGPGQAEVIIGSGANALGITNLHNWWLETYVDGGLPGFLLHLVFYIGLLLALWPVARSDPDPFMRYMASGCFLALVGFFIGALGPSSVIGFAPLWALYGLCLAVVSWSRLAARKRAAEGSPVAAAPVAPLEATRGEAAAGGQAGA
jgi:teichuronic acid biosynthesis protein TuaE